MVTPTNTPILEDDEAERQFNLLALLRQALGECGVDSVPARRHRLYLSGAYADKFGAERAANGLSGLTTPTLHIYTPAGLVTVFVVGEFYVLGTGQKFLIRDEAKEAVLEICRYLPQVCELDRCRFHA